MRGLGAGEDRMLATDFDLGAAVGDADPAYCIGVHFAAMSLRKPEGAAILRASQIDKDKYDLGCTAAAGADRAAIHPAIVDLIADQLGLSIRDRPRVAGGIAVARGASVDAVDAGDVVQHQIGRDDAAGGVPDAIVDLVDAARLDR